MRKYLLLLITIIIFVPSSALAVTNLSQKDFDQAKKGDNSKGLAFSKEYNNFYFEVDGEYRLTTDVTLKNSIVVNEADPELIIDLNGKTLKYDTTENDNLWFISVYDSKFTIKGNGFIKSNSNMKYLLVGAEGSNIIIENGTLEGRIAVDGTENKAKMLIKSGKIGSLSAIEADITIDNAIINSDNLKREAIYVDSGVNLVINGGNYESQNGALKSSSVPDDKNRTKIIINSGTFKGKENYGLILSGNEIVLINGGTFIDDNDSVVISDDDKSGIEKLINAGIVTGTIEITKGANSKYKEGSNDELSFTMQKDYNYFVNNDVVCGKVYIDDKLLSNDDFSITENTTIKIKKEYLSILSEGIHILKIVSCDSNYASTKITVSKSANPLIYFSIVGLCIVGVLGVVIYINKKSK